MRCFRLIAMHCSMWFGVCCYWVTHRADTFLCISTNVMDDLVSLCMPDFKFVCYFIDDDMLASLL